MRPPSAPFHFLLAFLSAVLTGCDQSTTSYSPGDANADATFEPPRLAIELSAITPLLPRLSTHVAIDSRGNIYWIQESEPTPPGGDLVFVMGDSGVPQTIPALSVPRILKALGMQEASGDSGAIRSMAIGDNDDLYILFTGGAGRTPICAIARYTPTSSTLKIMAGTRRLMDETGMGASLDLARGTLVSHGSDLWLWVRHTDAARLMRLVSIDGGSRLDFRPLHLKPPPEARSGQLTSEHEDLSAGPSQTLYYIDRPRAMLWKIDGGGDYTAIQSLEGFSSALTSPALDQEGRMCLLAGNANPLFGNDNAAGFAPKNPAPASWVQLAYPALLESENSPTGTPILSTIRRDDFHAPAALPLQDLQPRQLLLDHTNGTLITFDAASGELLRVKLTKKSPAPQSATNR